jgi:hypothetical protein
LHRAIFDPLFSREVAGQSWGRVALFMVKLLVFASLIMGFSKAFYLAHSERGIAALVNALFGGMEIRDGRLLAGGREMPYAPPGDALAALMDRFVGQPNFFGRLPENFLVVDTRDPPTAPPAGTEAAPAIILKESSVRFEDVRVDMPYEALIGKKDLEFTASSVQEYLNSRRTLVIAHFTVMSLFFGFFSILMSAFFLSVAAYIFSADRSPGYRYFLRIACYSVTPVMLGGALVSLTGVSADWMWHVFIVVSTIVMFRAMANRSPDKPAEEKREAQ